MRPDPVEKPTLTVEEAGAVLNVSRTVAYAMARDGRLPVIRANTRLIVPTQAFLNWLDNVEPTKSALDPEPVALRRPAKSAPRHEPVTVRRD
jgi:excisionase family DNA binding protein